MKRSLFVVAALAATFTVGASAQTSQPPSAPAPASATPSAPPTGATKFAVIAFQPAVAATNEGRVAFAKIQQKFQPKQTELKGLSDQIDALKKQLQADGSTLESGRARIAVAHHRRQGKVVAAASTGCAVGLSAVHVGGVPGNRAEILCCAAGLLHGERIRRGVRYEHAANPRGVGQQGPPTSAKRWCRNTTRSRAYQLRQAPPPNRPQPSATAPPSHAKPAVALKLCDRLPIDSADGN